MNNSKKKKKLTIYFIGIFLLVYAFILNKRYYQIKYNSKYILGISSEFAGSKISSQNLVVDFKVDGIEYSATRRIYKSEKLYKSIIPKGETYLVIYAIENPVNSIIVLPFEKIDSNFNIDSLNEHGVSDQHWNFVDL